MEFNVMTFNFRVDTLWDGVNAWIFRKAAISKMIKSWNAVIIGTQESRLHMLKEVIKHSPAYDWVGRARRWGGEYCAVLYNKDIVNKVDSGTFWLSTTPSVPGSKSWGSAWVRNCTWAHFQFCAAPDQQFIVYNTHLDNRSQEARDLGLQVIWSHIQEKMKQTKLPVILMGDFNAEPNNSVIQYLRGLKKYGYASSLIFTDVYTKLSNGSLGTSGNTFHAFKGGIKGKTLDYIFVTQPFQVIKSTIDRRKGGKRYPSDHYPVIAKLLLGSFSVNRKYK